MNEFQIHEAIGQLPEELIAPAARLRVPRSKRTWVPWAAAAACLCLLLGLPVGMGSMSANSKADAKSPMEAIPEYGYSADSSLYSDVAVSEHFLATVIEVNSWGILVEPLEDEWERSSADRVEVSFSQLEAPPAPEPGDLVRVTYSGMLEELYPARAVKVTDVRIIG